MYGYNLVGPFVAKAIGIVILYILFMVFIWKVTTVERDVK